MRTVDGQFGLLDASWKIYVETDSVSYVTIANIVKSGIKTTTGYDLTIAALSTRSDSYDQIVIGDVSSDSISAITARYQRNTIGLGDEGYNLISLPNAVSGKWLVVIAANEVAGARHGAYTLVDLVEAAPDTLNNVRIRDYPDSPHREVQHWLESIPKNDDSAQAWLDVHKAQLDTMGAWGANIVAFGRGNFTQMGVTPAVQGVTHSYGYWLHQLTDYADSRGVAPGVDITGPPSGHWKEREGWYVDREPFTIEPDSSLKPLYEFQNKDFNMSFDTLNASGWPTQWEELIPTYGWGQSNGWDIVNDNGDVHVRLAQATKAQTAIFQRLYKSPGLINTGLQGFSLYVLTVRFGEIDWYDNPEYLDDNPNLAIRVIGYTEQDCPQVTGVLPSPPYGQYAFDLAAWATPWMNDGGFKTFSVQKADSFQTVDFYFWTPPDSEQALAPEFAGFPCPHFEDVDSIEVRIEAVPQTHASNIVMEIEDMYLERRASALRNVMWWPGGDLGFKVEDVNHTAYTDTTFDYRPPVGNHDYWMETFPLGWENPEVNRTTVTSTNPSAVGDTVYVSYTVGVPKGWHSVGTTYCFKSPELMSWHRDNLDTWFLDPVYSFDPRFITLRLDEHRGMNRCQRGREATTESNADHLVDYIVRIQGMLDDIAATQDPAAAWTQLIVYSDMTPVDKHGLAERYQLQWGGKYGAMVTRDHEFGILALSNARTIFPVGFKDIGQVRPGSGGNSWPSSENAGPNVSVIGWMIDHQPEGTPKFQVPETADNDTWYDSDAQGFLAASEYYHDNRQTDEQLRLLDYAWKRYQHPKALLHARQEGIFVTNSFLADTLYAAPFEVLEFAAFGSAEVRDPVLKNERISAATVTWGDGSPTESVFDSLNRGLIRHSWTSLALQTYEVTLTVTATDNATGNAKLFVTVDPDDPDVTHWSGTHELHEDYRVEAGKVLVVDPGTTVIADAGVGITVHGAMGVAGTPQDTVTFRASDTSDFGGWDGILVQDSISTSSAVIDYCTFQNSSGGLGVRNLLTIRNSTIRNCEKLGLSIASAADVYASHLTIQNIVDVPGLEGMGVQVTNSAHARIEDCTVADSHYGVLLIYQAELDMLRCTIGNHVEGIFAQHTATVTADSCVVDSSWTGIHAAVNAQVAVSDCDIWNAYEGLYLGGGATTVSLDHCTFDSDTTGAYIGGSGHAVTISNCTFTNSINEAISCVNGPDVTIIGNTISGGFIGVKLDASTPIFNDNTIEDNTTGLHCDNYSSPTLKRNVFDNNTTGITTLSGSSPLLDRCSGSCSGGCNDANSITADYGLRIANLDQGVMIDGECNYYGTAGGKGGGGGPDPSWFIGQVDYDPSLSNPPAASAPFEDRTERLPTVYGLSDNYPNPFNPVTTIAYQVPPPGGKVRIAIYNVLGQRVTTLVDEYVAPGFYATVWPGVNERGNQVSSGMYFIQMRAKNFIQNRKLLLLK